MSRFLAVASLLFLGCSSDDDGGLAASAERTPAWSIAIKDAPTPLTSNPGEDLCRLELRSGEALVIAELTVTIQFPSGTPAAFRELHHDDTNGNQRWDVGESVAVNEGSASPFTEAYVGQTADVALLRDGKTIATGRWRTDN